MSGYKTPTGIGAFGAVTLIIHSRQSAHVLTEPFKACHTMWDCAEKLWTLNDLEFAGFCAHAGVLAAGIGGLVLAIVWLSAFRSQTL